MRRARMPMINELMGWDFVIGLLAISDLFR
jgi:hypothetical protein